MRLHSSAARAAAVLLLTLSAVFTTDLFSQGRRQGRRVPTTIVDGREAADGEVLVRYREAGTAFERARAESDADADEVEPIDRSGLRRIHSRRYNTAELLALLRANPDVAFVEPNWVIRADVTPNDPAFGSLWGLLNVGQSSGTPGADIDAPQAWDLTTGTRSVVVGVIDTGIDYNHPDLAANIWNAPSAFTVTIGAQSITCPAGSHGFNAIDNTCNPMDDHDHGTHVAGTIGGVGNNGIGVAGVNWRTSMMGLKFLDAYGYGWMSDAVKAIEFSIQAKEAFAATGGANVRVLSNSWGGGGYSQSLYDSISRAHARNILFVAAAGNYADNNDVYPTYPANYTAPNVIAVAATDPYDQRAWFSNYGAATVHLGAPGVAIYSTIRGGSYDSYNGTSMATPHVSGAAALLLARCDLPTAESLKSAILTQVDPIPSMAGVTSTGGRLNVNNAIRACPARPNPAPVATTVSPGTVYAGQNQFTLTVAGSGFVETSEVRVSGVARATSYVSPTQLTAVIPAGDIATAGLRSITVFNPAPEGGLSSALTLNVRTPPTIALNGTTGNITVAPGAPIAVALSGGPGFPRDWLGVHPAAAADGIFLDWFFFNGQKVVPIAGLGNTAFAISAPTQLGTYQLRFFADNSYTRMTTSAAITVAALPSIAIGDISVTEGNAGTTLATFTASLSAASTQNISAQFATSNGTATASADYQASAGTITFLAGSTTANVMITVNGDVTFESNETFALTLSNAVNAVLGDNTATATIVNDDAAIAATLTAPATPVAPGGIAAVTIANGQGNPTDWIGLYQSNAGDSTFVAWAYLNGLATPPAVGLTSATLQFVAPMVLGTYQFRLFSNNSYARIGTSNSFSVAAIQPPTLGISDVTVAEGNGGANLATFTVSLSPANLTQSVTVAFATADGTAGAGDYGSTSGTLTFAPSATLQTISINVHGDLVAESPETFAVNLSSPTNAMLGDAQGVATIVDDDGTISPSLFVPGPSVAPGSTFAVSVANGPANPADWVAFTRTGAADAEFIDWTYLNGTKVRPASGLSSATLQFVAPATVGTYEFRLYSNNSYTRLASRPLLVSMQPMLSINNVNVAEGNSGTTAATFTVTLAPANPTHTVTVAFATADFTALAPSDYTAASGTLVFAPSQTTQTISVSVNGDTTQEFGEAFFVNLWSPVNADLADAQGMATIVDTPPGTPVVTVSPQAAPGAAITVSVGNGPGNVADWVGLVPIGAADTALVDWAYLNGQKVRPASGLTSATLQLTAPVTPGIYEVRMFANNGYARLATSSSVTVSQ
jgi:subtilisin family serine protease